jgi:hypothetical protein
MTDLRKASEQALAVMTAKPSSITSADWKAAIDALRAAVEHDRRAALKHDRRVALNEAHQALQAEAEEPKP